MNVRGSYLSAPVLPAEERLRGLTPKDVAGGLTEEQAARLRELLDRGRDG